MTELDAKYYIEEIREDEQIIVKDIEVSFPGVYIQKVNGLLNKGKQKNVHIENFANKKGQKIYKGNPPIYEPTNVVFEIVIFGDDMIKSYKDFISYLETISVFYFYDNLRNVKAQLYLVNSTDADDIHINGQERIVLEIEFVNPNGDFEEVNNTL